MAQCKHIKDCAFYNNLIVGVPNEGTFFKQLYCMQISEKCARNKMSSQEDVSDVNNQTNPLGVEY